MSSALGVPTWLLRDRFLAHFAIRWISGEQNLMVRDGSCRIETMARQDGYLALQSRVSIHIGRRRGGPVLVNVYIHDDVRRGGLVLVNVCFTCMTRGRVGEGIWR